MVPSREDIETSQETRRQSVKTCPGEGTTRRQAQHSDTPHQHTHTHITGTTHTRTATDLGWGLLVV